ncbi:expressed protein [Batrachochytrium dendrobatidis JAM81]|uniref:Expressed protein n=1 Tax=Batrachochytrium dendrobatidis (strain JAM81 / FGSC 10211) TaxID=684364 RepID=F4NUS1_BATDJ|nr:uncharacterized protein BATDEDRAFT_36564 [Batrachochytrium dendrobatidis JAM81]EGF84434.1 expressed protein [Batrachochytrium dendrobatidis JAM81]|eukprot:XP_006675902.1 expressed protein [Batrachochytrium dendrobatidis JAM81]
MYPRITSINSSRKENSKLGIEQKCHSPLLYKQLRSDGHVNSSHNAHGGCDRNHKGKRFSPSKGTRLGRTAGSSTSGSSLTRCSIRYSSGRGCNRRSSGGRRCNPRLPWSRLRKGLGIEVGGSTFSNDTWIDRT